MRLTPAVVFALGCASVAPGAAANSNRQLSLEVNRWSGILPPYFQIVNVYNQNIFLYRFDYQDRPVTRTGISQFPIFPSFGVEFES